MKQFNLLKKFPDLKFKLDNLVKALIAFKEKNDKNIVINFEENKENLNKTFPEIDNLKLNLFAEGKPTEKFEIIDFKAVNKILKTAYSVEHEVLISQINATSSVCKKVKLTIVNDNDDIDENKINSKDDDEILTIEAGIAQILVCSNCSKVYLFNNNEYHILKYYEDVNKLRKLIKNCHKKYNKNKLGNNLVFYKDNYTLIKRNHGINSLELFMISIILVEKLYKIFNEIGKIKKEPNNNNNLITIKCDNEFKNLNNGIKNNNKNTNTLCRKYFYNELNIIPEKEISINLINDLIHNYLLQVPEDLYITPDEIFDEDEIKNCNMFIIKMISN